jgi:hypothetical protein
MTLPNLAPMPTAPAPQQRGWDPVEVWRTRVLLPRLAAEQKGAGGPSR